MNCYWTKFYDILWWGMHAKIIYIVQLKSAAMFWIVLKDKLLFIPFMILWKEYDITFMLNYSDFYYEIFILRKRGVTIGIRAGRSIRPSRWFVVSCDGWILSLGFLINGYVLLCDHVCNTHTKRI
jgi:hypothetical protein